MAWSIASNWPQLTGPPVWFFVALAAFLAVLALLPMLVRTEEETREEFWRGMFYVNRGDPALLVRKRYGIGCTLNFGNPWSFVVLGLIAVMIALPLVFVALMLHQSLSHMRQIPK